MYEEDSERVQMKLISIDSDRVKALVRVAADLHNRCHFDNKN